MLEQQLGNPLQPLLELSEAEQRHDDRKQSEADRTDYDQLLQDVDLLVHLPGRDK
ncbi:hypothetical protein D3C71_1929780 [compost metagenome]